MTNQNTKEVLRTIISEVIEETDFNDDTKFIEELGIDSMLIIEIIVRTEKAFNISISESYIPQFTDLNSMHSAIEKLIKNK